ncbi:hypothetical protein NKH10_31295 [Mesorhizobium sp. M1340]|uniref:hypothetical protein n=1 Tax=Mesorhizobium sp. M1340 TaxID=2957087 RepID=UPI00333815C3
MKPLLVSRTVPSAIGSQCSSWQHRFSYQLCADADGIPEAQAAAMIAPNPSAPRPLNGQIMIYIRLI